MDSYEPMIIGVTHLERYAKTVINTLEEKINEGTTVFLEPYDHDYGLGNPFWKEIIEYCESRKADIIYCQSQIAINNAQQRYTAWAKESAFEEHTDQPDSASNLETEIAQLERNMAFYRLKMNQFLKYVAEEVNPVAISQILAVKPRIIIMGGEGHALPIYERMVSMDMIKPIYMHIP